MRSSSVCMTQSTAQVSNNGGDLYITYVLGHFEVADKSLQ